MSARRILVTLMALVLLGATACEPLPPREGGPFVPPASIDRSGETEVSAQLQSFVDSVPDGSTVRFPSGASYRMSEKLRLFGRNDLTIDGNGATLFVVGPGNLWRSNIEVKRGSNVTIRDLTLRGANPNAGPVRKAYVQDKAGQHGIKAKSVNGLTVANVTITDTYGDFVYLGQVPKGPWTSDVVIRDSEFRRSGRQGITLVAAEDVVVESNRLVGVARSTFDFEPLGDDAGVNRVTLRDNVMVDGRLRFLAAVAWSEVNNISVVGNRMVNRPLATEVESLDGSTWYNWTFSDNHGDTRLLNSARTSMTFKHIDGLTIEGNRQRFRAERGMFGAKVSNVCNLNVGSNDFPGARAPAQHQSICAPGPVARLYLAYFDRHPDPAGLRYWLEQQERGRSLADISDAFARSAEFQGTYGSLSDRSFVNGIYARVLGRQGGDGGVDFWTGELRSGRRTRGEVMIGFSESAEHRYRTNATVSEIEERMR